MGQKRTLEELKVLYKFEPKLRDLYVEGSSDANFFRWYLNSCGVNEVTVYTVDVLDIPKDIVRNHSLPTGSAKGRLIALSCELAKTPAADCIMCIADRDFDVNGTRRTNPCLRWTDGNSLELYALRSTVFRKFLLVALGGVTFSPEDLFNQCITVLERVYSMRIANEVLGWKMSWVPFKRYVKVNGASIEYRESNFIRAYLQKNGRWGDQECFIAKVDEIVASLDRDPMRRIRGHDLSELLYIVVNSLRREIKFGNAATLESCLLAVVESDELRTFSLFKEIEAFCCRQNSHEMRE